MKRNLEAIKEKSLPILQTAGVIRSAIFGSYVRGEEKEDSDIDMLVELPKGKSLLDLIGLQLELEEALGKKVDLTTYKSISPLLKKYIDQDQLQIL